MKYSFKQLVDNNAKGFLSFDIYIKLFIYPLAIPLAWVLLTFSRVTANQVTLTGLCVGCLGAFCSFFFGLKYLAAGYLVAYILDFADGTLARNGRGGGETGVFLDVITDRTVLCFCVVMLMAHHSQYNQATESFVLLLYILAYLYEDILSYGLRVAKNRAGNLFVEVGPELVPLSIQNVFLQWEHLLPSRLSSPLFILCVGVLSGNMIWAYVVGLLIVLFGYVRGVRHMLVQKKSIAEVKDIVSE